MAKIEFILHRYENINETELQGRVDALQNQYNTQVEDGSGNYETTVKAAGDVIYESTLYDLDGSGGTTQDGRDMLADWQYYIDNNYSTSAWTVHGLVLDYFEQQENGDHYDLSDGGGWAYPGSAERGGRILGIQ